MNENKRVIVIGAGASGVACAVKLKMLNLNTEVIVIEQNDKILKKLLKTGNGRCNITNEDMNPRFYNDSYFLGECLKKFSKDDLEVFFKGLGLLIKSDAAGRVYPYSETATSVVEVFNYTIKKLDIIVNLNEKLESFVYNKDFEVKTDKGKYRADYLVMATGSIAQEKTNTYDVLKLVNHNISPLRPGLCPLKTKENLKAIRGIRVKALAKVISMGKNIYEEEGEILFKERGLSGILTLNLSRHVRIGDEISLDLFYERPNIISEIEELLESRDLKDALFGILPRMLVLEIMKRNPDLKKNLKKLRDLRFEISDYYGYEIAQITVGGLSVGEVNDDFSSIYNPNLYIIGETLDIDGASGGYNLHFAWMSGILSGLSINSRF